MKKTSSEIPLWAKILFETPEFISDIVNSIKNRIKRTKVSIAQYLLKTSE
jgi:hypothetical protein